MSRFGELMALFLQETEETKRNKRTIVDLLTERTMNGGGGRLRRRKSLHQRLGLKSMVCCGSTWGFGIGTSAISTQANNNDDEDDNNNNNNEDDVIQSTHQRQMDVIEVNLTHHEISFDPGFTLESPRMNLADALAAERYFRSVSGTESDYVQPLSPEMEPLRMSLMRLLEETETETETEREGEDDEGMGKDQMCCVCMGRKKGAAFIPCGHTYCRVCCRELWLNRGSCPQCNRSILEILDIY